MYHLYTNIWDTIDSLRYCVGLTELTSKVGIVCELTRDKCLTDKVLVLDGV